MQRLFPWVTATMLAAAAMSPAVADRADRSQPLTIEAERQGAADLAKRLIVFTGNVVITQGTMRITADRVEVRETPDGARSALALGDGARPATFRQKRDGVDEFIEGRAERIEYDSRVDTVRLAGNATLRRLRNGATADEVSGQLITYDNVNELFTASGGADGSRVRAVLSPREGSGTATPDGARR